MHQCLLRFQIAFGLRRLLGKCLWPWLAALITAGPVPWVVPQGLVKCMANPGLISFIDQIRQGYEITMYGIVAERSSAVHVNAELP